MSLYPSFKIFKKNARKGTVIPVSIELPADLDTPVSVFLKIANQSPHAFLLESVELGENLGRFSLIGIDPDFILEYSKGVGRISGKRQKSRNVKSDFLSLVKKSLSAHRFVHDKSLPPLVGSLIGYVGYELVQQFDCVKLKSQKGIVLPDSVLFFPRTLVVFDHVKHTLKIVHLSLVQKSLKRAYLTAIQSLNKVTRKLQKPSKRANAALGIPSTKIENNTYAAHPKLLRSNMSRARFEKLVTTCKSHIRKGNCIQIVISQRFDAGYIQDDFSVYRALRSLNPSPYMFYFRHKDLTLVGSSPEVLARKTGRHAEVRPIAGTRRRGFTENEDRALENELRNSKKEMAEHLMLVDLGRNDLGRVAKATSVKVSSFARTERYSHVMHLVSNVEATLKKGKTALDVLKAAFPAGTVTGAPKIRAMQIIDELEQEKRGPYAGCLGYFTLAGDMDMCITIRTIVIHKKRAYVQAGAGIVSDSVPKHEYTETINKARALFHAIELARGIS